MDETNEIASRLAVAVIASRGKAVSAAEAVKIYLEIKLGLESDSSGFVGTLPETGFAR